MLDIPGYRIIERIYDSSNSHVYRALRDRDNKPVVLKALKKDCPCSEEELTRYRQEYEITRALHREGIIRAYDLEMRGDVPVIVLEDIGGESLDILAVRRSFTLEEALSIGGKIAASLGQIHSENVIHKDINPSNVIFNPRNGLLKVIDFGISTSLSSENPTVGNPKILEGTLPYLAPEQTGRIDRTPDYRTDFYSLGATLYELFAGTPPFQARDAMEMVHCHIAREPVPLHEVDPSIPRAVSRIVMKLLRKTVDERYQSADGIGADLDECLRQFRETGTVASFPLGAHDISDRFHIPQKLYGRDEELSALMAEIEQMTSGASPPADANAGGSELILVSGLAGIGKTSLVREVYRPLTSGGRYFISGKFEQFQRDTPYLAFVQAFRELAHHLLTENEAELKGWRERLLAALGANARLIIDMLPEIELILGPQPEAAPLPPRESQHRFDLTLQNFIHAFTEAQHSLVIFLDDLHWADAASLRLIQLLMAGSKPRNLFLIGAYRNEGLSEAHPLHLTLDAIDKQGSRVTRISLLPLQLRDVNQLISESLNRAPEETAPLGELVFAKTKGNPFFIREFLKSLIRDGLIEFDRDARRWTFDLDRISACAATDNVVELLTERILHLRPDARDLLKFAAVIGNRFDPESLSTALDIPPGKVLADLEDLIAEGFIFSLGESRKLIDSGGAGPSSQDLRAEYRFSHDRIQQAAYNLIPAEQRKRLHLSVGRTFLNSVPEEARTQKILDIVNHLNQAIELIDGRQERDELAALNLAAGRKAKTSAAYGAVLKYLGTGIGLLDQGGWERQYDLALHLHSEAAEAACLTGEFGEMERLIAEVLDRAGTLLDRVYAWEILLWSYTAQNRLLETVSTGLKVCRELGWRIPEHPSTLNIMTAFLRVRLQLHGRRIENLAYLPEMTDPRKLAIMRILGNISGALHKAFPQVFPLTTFKLTEMSIRYGNTGMSAVAYCGYGMILCSVIGDMESGYRFGKMGMDVTDCIAGRGYRTMAMFVFNAFIRHWKEHLRESCTGSLETYQTGCETGDLTYGAYALAVSCSQAFLCGKNLEELEPEISKHVRAIDGLRLGGPLYSMAMVHQVILNLRGQSADLGRLAGNSFDEEKMLPLLMEAGDRTSLFLVFFYRTFLFCLVGKYRQAIEAAAAAEKHIDAVRAMAYVPVFHFYSSLARLSVASEAGKPERRRLLREVATSQKKMKKWAHHAPENYLHKYFLIEAERTRVLVRDMEAMGYYDRAINLAAENGYVQDEALANEMAALFFSAKGKGRIAMSYFSDARNAYLRWGAVGKVKAMDSGYAGIPAAKPERPSINGNLTAAPLEKVTSQTISTSGSEPLDLASVIKTSQTISSEIELEKLLARLIEIVVENAGAEKGFLILRRGQNMSVEAMVRVDAPGFVLREPIPLDECRDLLCTSVVAYAVRTGEDVVLNDAANEGLFIQDAYVRQKLPKSILCTPVMQASFTGVLYLENNLAAGTFTPDRIKILGMLISQAAISIVNARLYADLADSEKQYRSLYEKYHALYANAVEGIFQSTPEGRLLGANPSMAAILGFGSPKELLALVKDIYALYVRPEDRRELKRILDRDGQVLGMEVQIYRRDGSKIWVSLHGRAVRDSEGGALCYEGSLVDVTERKKAQKALQEHQKHLEYLVGERTRALRESERILVTLMSNLPGMAYRCLNDRHRTMKFVSEGAYELVAYTPEELTGNRPAAFGELIHPEDREYVWETVQSAVALGKAFQLIYRILPKGGEQKWVWEQGTGVMESDRGTLTIEGFITDITARKKMEEELVRAQKLESVGSLAAGIAHDFNNLLTIILGGISLARLDLEPESRALQNLKKSEEASLQARDLTHQFMTFAEGGQPVKMVGTILNVIQGAVNLALSGSNLNCRMNISDDLWPADCDHRQIHHAINYVVMNARESMPGGGTIDVEARNVWVTTDQVPVPREGKYIMISIRDHGNGIPQEHLSRVFDPYFSTKERGVQKGMGLGLAITYRIIKQHEGHVVVDSEPDVGTSVHIYLPAGQEKKSIAAPASAQRSEGRVLLMDDEQAIRDMAVQILGACGYEVVAAKDGEESIELYRSAGESGPPFDVVILDLTVRGGMDGREAIRRLIELDGSVKAIVSSGYSDDPIMSDFGRYGFMAAIPKPYTIKELDDAIQRLIRL